MLFHVACILEQPSLHGMVAILSSLFKIELVKQTGVLYKSSY